MEIQGVVDELRGELDRANHQSPGWSGPATEAYMRGYGAPEDAAAASERATYHETHITHGGWY